MCTHGVCLKSHGAVGWGQCLEGEREGVDSGQAEGLGSGGTSMPNRLIGLNKNTEVSFWFFLDSTCKRYRMVIFSVLLHLLWSSLGASVLL